MKNTWIKGFLAVIILLATFGVAAGSAGAAGTVVMDNLSKYGLKKDVELPVTVTAAGLSYTLQKIMIFDFNSSTALALRKEYKYGDISGLIADPQYLIWTKITITNKSKKTVERSYKDMLYKWNLYFEDGGIADPVVPFSKILEKNSKEALADFKLKPSESFTTYQALYYKGDFKYFSIGLRYDGKYVEKYVVNDPELAQ